MSVFFGVKLKLNGYDSHLCPGLMFGGRRILEVDRKIAEEEFAGWCNDLAVDFCVFPAVTKSQSDEVYLILPKFYYDGGFDRDRIIVPDNQFVKVCGLQECIKVPNWYYYDVMVLMARYDDMFCVVDREGWMLYVVLPGESYAKRVTRIEKLKQVVAELKSKSGSAQFECYLTESTFNNRHWCETRPSSRLLSI